MNDEWKKNATTWIGIPLHPSGEISLFDYVNGKQDNYELSKATIRARLMGIQFQFMFSIISGPLFIYNLISVIKTRKTRPYSVSSYCCLISSLLGITYSIVSVIGVVADKLNCRQMVWYLAFVVSFSMFFNSITILHRTHRALLCQKWVAVWGTIFTLPQFGFLVIICLFSYITIEQYMGCTVHYPFFLSWYWLGTMLPINMFFSAIFSAVAYRQYKTYGSDAWKRLARNGIQTMCLVVLCNLICGFIVIFELGRYVSQMFFIANWCLTTTILVNDLTKKYANNGSTTEEKNAPNVYSVDVDINEITAGYSSRFVAITNYI